MKIISGKFRGKTLKTLDGEHTRPTLSRVKESIFNIIQFEILDKNVLDLFAGSGQMGIEALSRGAKSVVFVDNFLDAAKIINQNLQTCNCSANVVQCDFRDIKLQAKSIDIIFLDPPYDSDLLNDVINFITKLDILSENGIIVCESNKNYNFNIDKPICIKKQYTYGKVLVTTLEKEKI